MSGTKVASEIAEGHANAPHFYPENVVIVGVDIPDDPAHGCSDPTRIVEPDEDWVTGLDENGVITPIIIWKDDHGRWCVVEGRRRTLGLRLANIRAKNEKRPAKEILAVAVKGDHKRIAALKVLLNIARKDYDPVTKGEHINDLIDRYHFTDKVIATMMGVSVGAIYVWKTFGDASPDLKAAVRSGKVKQGPALELAKMPRAEQPEAIAKLVALTAPTVEPEGIVEDDAFSGVREKVAEPKKVRGANARAAAKAIAKGEEPSEPRTRRLTPSMCEKIIEEMKAEGKDGEIAAKAIRFVLGDAGAWRGFPELLAACKRAGWERPGKE